METAQKTATEIPEKLVEETTRKYFNDFRLFGKKGATLALINAGIWENPKGLKKGDLTKLNIVNLISFEIAKKIGVDPKNKEEYHKTRTKIRGKIAEAIKKDEKLKKTIEKISKSLVLRVSEKTGQTFAGKIINKTNLARRKALRKNRKI